MGSASGTPGWEVDASSWLDAVFDVLAHSRRRCVLYCLVRDPDGVLERSDLVAAVRAFEEGDGATDGAAVERDLHHAHLPKLAGAGLLDYDRRQGTVRYTGSPGLEAWVDRAREVEGAEASATDS